jgi:hypothetical protein
MAFQFKQFETKELGQTSVTRNLGATCMQERVREWREKGLEKHRLAGGLRYWQGVCGVWGLRVTVE